MINGIQTPLFLAGLGKKKIAISTKKKNPETSEPFLSGVAEDVRHFACLSEHTHTL